MTDFTEWGMWVYRAVVTQANAAGGAVVLDITPGAGDTMVVVSATAANSGTNSLDILVADEDNNIQAFFVSVASAATTQGAIPQALEGTGTDSLVSDSTPVETRIIRGDDHLVIRQGGAGAQNDTITITIRAFLSSSSIPTVSKARSTNQGDVTIGTPTVNKVL